jgi:TonB family protein
MILAMPRHSYFLPLTFFGLGLSLLAQPPQKIYKPLGDTLTKALSNSSLTSLGSHPFHLKLHIHDAMNPDSDVHADIEEFWNSPTQWKRTVTTSSLSQTITVNDSGTFIESKGDYFPIWLRNFVTALFDPLPNADSWNKPEAQLEQTVSPSGNKSSACLKGHAHVSSGNSIVTETSICFFDNGLLSTVDQPGYNMAFNKFINYNDRSIASLYISQPTSEDFLVGKITELENSNKKPTFFSPSSDTTATNTLTSLHVSQSSIEQMAGSTIHIDWPLVTAGKTDGSVLVFVSIDRTGRVREASTVGTDNFRVTTAALDQLLKMQWSPAVIKGNPVQVDALINLPFSTQLAPQSATTINNNVLKVPDSVVAGRKIEGVPPIFPEIARQQHQGGTVYLHVIIGKEGTVTKIGIIDAPSQALGDAAMDAVRRWKYTPWLLNGEPTEVTSTVQVNFNFN